MIKTFGNCEVCNKELKRRSKTCSNKCASIKWYNLNRKKEMIQPTERKCKHCGTKFTPKASKVNRIGEYCYDKECRNDRQRIANKKFLAEGKPYSSLHIPRPKALKRFMRFGNKMATIQKATVDQLPKLIANYY